MAARRAAARDGGAGGFTLIELMVSMAAGLVVALAVVNLSREATTTFHEETRIAATEMQLRTAVDRLRADLARAAFMSTGNIFIDPTINLNDVNNRLGNYTTNVNQGRYSSPTAYQSASGDMSLYDLAGIRLFEGGGGVYTPLTLSTVNFGTTTALNPDTIEIGGDLTGVELLAIGTAPNGATSPITSGTSVCGGAQTINLDVTNTPALWRLVGMSPTANPANYGAALQAAFQPVAGASFIVRIVDDNTRQVQYAATCASQTVFWASGGQPHIDLDTNSNVVGLTGQGIQATVNPVQIVRWQIQQSTLNADAGTGAKYDLVRQFLDAYGAPAGTGEVIAVDLKFAFTFDTVAATSNYTANYAAAKTPTLRVNSFEKTDNTIDNATVAGDVANSIASQTVPTGPYPQRIRSVRVRLATRAAIFDRTDALSAGAPYLYRYCVNPVGCAGTPPQEYARTRTLISEVATPNQASLFFQ
jgi:prepilin-type N-terminal cleavage/methylation domain-containing protein